MFDEGKLSTGILRVDRGAFVEELQPKATERGATVNDARTIETIARSHGKRFTLGQTHHLARGRYLLHIHSGSR